MIKIATTEQKPEGLTLEELTLEEHKPYRRIDYSPPQDNNGIYFWTGCCLIVISEKGFDTWSDITPGRHLKTFRFVPVKEVTIVFNHK